MSRDEKTIAGLMDVLSSVNVICCDPRLNGSAKIQEISRLVRTYDESDDAHKKTYKKRHFFTDVLFLVCVAVLALMVISWLHTAVFSFSFLPTMRASPWINGTSHQEEMMNILYEHSGHGWTTAGSKEIFLNTCLNMDVTLALAAVSPDFSHAKPVMHAAARAACTELKATPLDRLGKIVQDGLSTAGTIFLSVAATRGLEAVISQQQTCNCNNSTGVLTAREAGLGTFAAISTLRGYIDKKYSRIFSKLRLHKVVNFFQMYRSPAVWKDVRRR
jgi:hypothetical protein